MSVLVPTKCFFRGQKLILIVSVQKANILIKLTEGERKKTVNGSKKRRTREIKFGDGVDGDDFGMLLNWVKYFAFH